MSAFVDSLGMFPLNMRKMLYLFWTLNTSGRQSPPNNSDYQMKMTEYSFVLCPNLWKI